MTPPLPRAGWLFSHSWDAQAMHRLGHMARFDTAGFDLLAFPCNAALIHFDVQRFAARQAERGRQLGWRAVLSHHEQFGALAASLVAEHLMLPGAPPEAILAAQHKLHARQVLQQVAPEANLAFAPLPTAYGEAVPEVLAYPRYAKPVKAAFSVLARRVENGEDLHAHTRFGRRELWVIRRLVEPFERVCRERLPQAGTAHRMILEEPVPLNVPQFNLDGWAHHGRAHALGVVDAVMYPGTQAFMRWQVPSRLPSAIQARALDVAQRFLGAIGYRTGLFNLEFFYDAATDRLSVIECNPRMASQFGDLYARVAGHDAHAMGVALALGEDPLSVPRREPTAAVAASLVYRSFPGERVPAPPTLAQVKDFHQAFARGLVFSFPRSGHGLARDYKWTGSHRYGVVHMGAQDWPGLREDTERASVLLGWHTPYADRATESLTQNHFSTLQGVTV